MLNFIIIDICFAGVFWMKPKHGGHPRCVGIGMYALFPSDWTAAAMEVIVLLAMVKRRKRH